MANTSLTAHQKALLAKYLDGESTPDEKAWVESWYHTLDNGALPAASKEAASLNNVKRRLQQELGHRPQRNHLAIFIRVAAIFLILATGAYFLFKPATSPHTYHAKNGELRTIELPDGSKVSLNGGSTIELSKDFNQTNRALRLTGEAFFIVTHDSERPFIVNTGDVKTRVLGTSFNIAAYPDDANIAVTVTSGKVQVEKATAKLSEALTPGHQLVFKKAEDKGFKSTTDTARSIAWRSGTVYFEDESIPEIARKLERKYGLEIKVQGPIAADCRYTLRFSDEPLDKALEVLGKVSGIHYHFENKNLLIMDTGTCK